jgi:hypothetical protein
MSKKVSKMKVYLAGSVSKGDKDERKILNWRKDYKQKLSSIEELKFLDPSDITKFEGEPLLVFGGDCSYIKKSDLIIVFAGVKIGVGTAQEMLVAKYFRKPVITVLPKDTHHRRSYLNFEGRIVEDWIHPFIFSTSDLIVEKIEDAISWIEEYIKNPGSKKIKDISLIDNAIKEYKRIKKGT